MAQTDPNSPIFVCDAFLRMMTATIAPEMRFKRPSSANSLAPQLALRGTRRCWRSAYKPRPAVFEMA